MANNGKTQDFWLIGSSYEEIYDCILPAIRQVLQRFLHLHVKENGNLQECARETSKEVIALWTKKGIPCREERNVVVNIKKLHSTWLNLKKDKNNISASALQKRNDFTDQLDNLFDIVSMSKIDQSKLSDSSKALLTALRKHKRVDQKLIDESEQDNEEIEKINKKPLKRTIEDKNQENDHLDSIHESLDNQLDNSQQISTKKQKINVMTDDVCAALDRTKVSNRNAVYIVGATCKALDHNVQDVVFSAETIRLRRQNYRERVAHEIKTSFSPNKTLVVHWDGKMLPALTSKESVDRLAVLVSGEDTMKLLGVPIITAGTGEAQAQAVYELLLEWNLADRINAMCFDTTASNSGNNMGACTLLEGKLGRTLLALACRHHVMELPISAVFNALFGVSSGPKIQLFERFQKQWSSIDKTKYESGLEDVNIRDLITPVRKNLLKFTEDQMNNFQPRDDYKELLQLISIFLGENTIKPVHINAPGAVHRARWMAKIIYCFKIYVLRNQFSLRAPELTALRQFNVFVIRVYIKNWYTCQRATLAPSNDLQLMKDILEYKVINSKISETAFKTMSRHMWYLSEKLVGLAFFESTIPVAVKKDMVLALENEGCKNPPRKITINNDFVNRNLPDFITRNTREFFKAMVICEDFLTQDPNLWTTNEHYLDGQRKLLKLKVVNDAAERGVALIQNYNTILTNREDQKQYLLQVVEKNRQDIEKPTKSKIIQALRST